jgi:hypothetical protein
LEVAEVIDVGPKKSSEHSVKFDSIINPGSIIIPSPIIRQILIIELGLIIEPGLGNGLRNSKPQIFERGELWNKTQSPLFLSFQATPTFSFYHHSNQRICHLLFPLI